jgi:hypothetical protein
MFSTTKTYIIEILSEGIKECPVRWPTDEEWATFFRMRRIVRKQLGGGRARTEFPDNEKAAGLLLAKIRMDEAGPLFDDSEAEDIIDRLSRCDLVDVYREGATFVIEQQLLGGVEVKHVLRIPSAKQRRRYENSSSQSTDGNRERVTKLFVEPGGELYDACVVSTEGYEGPVPVVHKWAAVSEMLSAIDAVLSEPRPEASAPAQ